jgi:hypothetical protein
MSFFFILPTKPVIIGSTRCRNRAQDIFMHDRTIFFISFSCALMHRSLPKKVKSAVAPVISTEVLLRSKGRLHGYVNQK